MKRNPERLEWIRGMNEKPFTEPEIIIGVNTRIHETVTLGGDGHSMEIDEEGNWVRCRHFGGIKIGDGVHLGEHVNVKRSTLEDVFTLIGDDSKICAYSNIAHNCKIGKHVFFGPHVCLNGSVEIGDYAWIAGHAVIGQHCKIGEGAVVGLGAVLPPRSTVKPGETVVGVPAVLIQFVGNHVHLNFKYGLGLKIGKFCHIHEDVHVGDNVTFRSYVELRPNTVIGDDCYIDSGVKTSGDCVIGDDVTLRYDAIIAKGVRIYDNVFISPQFMSENFNHKGEAIGGAHIGTGKWDRKTKYRVFIGTDVTLAAGIEIVSGTIIGSKANVRKSILTPGVYYGNPARRIK